MNDVLLGYSFEGQESPTGSLGSCSILESEDDLQFLNTLGLKFKTLADACTPPKLPTSSASLQIDGVEPLSLPPTAQEASLSSKVAASVTTANYVVKPVVNSDKEQSVVTKKTDVNLETVNVSKMTVCTVPQPTIMPQSSINAFSHSSNIAQAATLPCPAQTLVMQQQPVYYTSDAVLQPMQYVVRPHFQSTLLLSSGEKSDNISSLYVVGSSQNLQSSGLVMTAPHGASSGLVVPSAQVSPTGVLISATQGPLSRVVVPSNQGPSSGIVFQGTESTQKPLSPISPVSPTVLVPVGQVVAQNSVSVEGWKMAGTHPAGSFTLVKPKSSLVAPGSSLDSLPRVASLVKGAAPPQGVLSPAAHGSVFGLLPRHTPATDIRIVAVQGLGWEGNSHVDCLKTVVIGPLQVGLGHMRTANAEGRAAGSLPFLIGPPGKPKLSMNNFQPLTHHKEVLDCVQCQKAYNEISSQNQVRVPNTEKTPPVEKSTYVPKPLEIKMSQGKNILVFNNRSDAHSYQSST